MDSSLAHSTNLFVSTNLCHFVVIKFFVNVSDKLILVLDQYLNLVCNTSEKKQVSKPQLTVMHFLAQAIRANVTFFYK
jgi:hypothetical protein